jgi:hypothetical protein
MKQSLFAFVVAVAAFGAVMSWGAPHRVKNPFEVIPADEAKTIDVLAEIIRRGVDEQAGDEKVRDAHPKAHGCVAAKFTVTLPAGQEKELGIGIFKSQGKTRDAIVRASSGSDDPHADDRAGGPQGLAVKILLGNEDLATFVPIPGELFFMDKKFYLSQDIIGISAGENWQKKIREFFVNDVKGYVDLFAAQKASKDILKTPAVIAKIGEASAKAAAEATKAGKTPDEIRAEANAAAVRLAKGIAGKTFMDTFFGPDEKPIRPVEKALFFRQRATTTLDPFIDEYNSWVPSLYGSDKAVKYRWQPCEYVDPATVKLPKEVDKAQDKNYLGAALRYRVANGDVCYKLAVQFHKEGMPSVENASAHWPVDASEGAVFSPFVEVGELKIAKNSEILSDKQCRDMSFNPGHTLEEHFPIGGMQRARMDKIYVTISNERNLKNGNKPLN